MKITVQDTVAVVIIGLIYSAPRASMYFAGAFLGSSLLLPLVLQTSIEAVSLWVGLMSIGVLLVFVLRQIIDSVLHARDTSLTITKTNIDCEVSGFTTNSFSIPLNQISNVRVSQAFLDKFFGVSSVVVSQIAGTFSVYGFNYSEAKKFSKAFSEKQHSDTKK